MPNTKADQGEVKSPNVEEINYQEDIHNPTIEDIASGMSEESEGKPEIKVEEKPVEKVEEKPELKEAPVEKPAIDEEKLTEKITESISKKLIEEFAPTDATKEEKKDLKGKLKDLEDKAKEEGRELTYGEALEFLQKETKESLKEELKGEVKQEVLKDLAKEVEDEDRKEKEAQEKAAAETTKVYNDLRTQWDSQLGGLEQAGKLLPFTPEDRENKESQSYKQRMDFLEQMRAYNIEQRKGGKPEITNMVEFHTLYYRPSDTQPGKNAPVGGSKRSVNSSGNSDFTNAEIHNASLEDIIAGR